MSLVLCPKCSQRNWSSDYFVCSHCGYEESRKWVLLEENKEFNESRSRGDNPQLDLNFWMREQKNLCQEMVNNLGNYIQFYSNYLEFCFLLVLKD